MGRPEIVIPSAPYVYGGELEPLCRECRLPCRLGELEVDCLRRFFLQGFLQCTYLVHGYCFLVDEPGCVFDNGGLHDVYWMNLLNPYFHDVGDARSRDPDFVRNAGVVKQLIDDSIQTRQVSLCRYLEEHYNRVMETVGGMSEGMMERLDEAYTALLAGTSRKL
ncbi:MAG: hypothetical protein P8181_02880 [bacterium]